MAVAALASGPMATTRTTVVNCDGLHTVAQTTLNARLGAVDDVVLDRVCSAVQYALGC